MNVLETVGANGRAFSGPILSVLSDPSGSEAVRASRLRGRAPSQPAFLRWARTRGTGARTSPAFETPGNATAHTTEKASNIHGDDRMKTSLLDTPVHPLVGSLCISIVRFSVDRAGPTVYTTRPFSAGQVPET